MDSSAETAGTVGWPAARPGAAAGEDGAAWLTTLLRPAGSLDPAAVRRLGTALGCLAVASDMAVLDLSAVTVPDPRTLARALREPAAAFDRAGRCLLVVGASAALTAEFNRAAVAVVTIARDLVPAQTRAA